MGITERRERNWVINYLAEPNKMRAAKDPIALELARSYKVLMPNLALTNKQLEEVMEYLEAKTVERPKTAEAPQAVPVAAAVEQPAAAAHDHHNHVH
jgi:protein SCO1/2